MIRVIHIIVGLGSGGAENMLLKVLKYSNYEEYYHEVISLTDIGTLGAEIQERGIKVHCLNLKAKNFFSSIVRVKNICENFDIINTWMYHSDFIGFIVGKILCKKKLIWNVRHSNLELKTNKLRTLLIAKINAILAHKVDMITYNSEKAYETHSKFGYNNKKSIVVENGFELEKFKFDPFSRDRLRRELKLNDVEKVLITVGRWNIQKDYNTLIKGLAKVKKNNADIKMIMVGKDLEDNNKELVALISKYNLNDNIILLGLRKDIPQLLSVADIYISSSQGESFSNAIGEAMACELPCIVTDTGDSKKIVGDSGSVINVKDYGALADKIDEMFKRDKLDEMGKIARERIIKNYEIRNVVKKYEENILSNKN